MINFNSKIFVAGHKGLVGSAIVRQLKEKGYSKVITIDKEKLDLTNQSKVHNFLKKNKPDFIFLAAAKVGGILSNNRFKAEFIYNNLSIQLNIIHSAYRCGIKDIIFLGSSCVYPRDCKQPIKENYLLGGKLEKTNDAYAIAKIAGIKMCESYNEQYNTNYKCLMPTNTFGPNDNYDELNSHFFPALIKKMHQIKIKNKNTLKVWGDGSPRREVIYVDDLARACVFFMKKKKKRMSNKYWNWHRLFIIPNRNIKIVYDKKKPNGTPKKVLDIKLARKYGWKPKFKLNQSILKTYNFFLKENKA